MAQARPKCLFCEAPSVSNEHIIALWIGRALSGTVSAGLSVVFRHWSAHPEAGIAATEKTAKLPAYRTRAFCRECNGVWMSRLEQRVQPVLEPLILGRPATLSVDDQALLAFWATKTLLAFQSIEHHTTKWARREDYAALYGGQAALPHSQVWLGASRDEASAAWQRAHCFQLPGDAPEAVDGFGATLIVGHAVFYLLIGYAGRVGLRLRYEAAFALKEIWPNGPRELRWPPAHMVPNNPETGLVTLVRSNSSILPSGAS